MKKITLFLLWIVTTATSQVGNYNVGDVVDDFTVTDTDGIVHNLYTITAQGKHVWLDFFFVDCGPCRQTAPIFNEFYDKYGCNDGEVYALSINLGNDDDAYVEWYEQQFGGPFNHAPAASGEGGAGPVTSNFGVNAFPTYCLIGPDNTLLNGDIWPLTGVETFENSFPTGFDPPVMACTLGVANNSSFDFNLFPTISNGNLTLELPKPMKSTVTIYNMLGQEVFQQDYSEKIISLNLQISAGTHLVKITSEENTVLKRVVFY